MRLLPFSIALSAALASCGPIPPQQPQQTILVGEQVKVSPADSRKRLPSKPNLERLPNGHYRVLDDWQVRVSGRDFLVQKGYISNGITAPKSVKSFLGDHVSAPETWTAVFHDWCFTQQDLTRAQCDSYYIQLMRDFRISPQKISIMGATVRGYSIYKGN